MTMKPHLSREAVEQATAEICLMPFFPSSDVHARAMVLRYFFDLCNDDEQVLWLAKRYVTLFTKWAGLRELRAVACSKFKPRDGVEVYSETYIDGIPSEKPSEPLQLAGPENIKLLDGHVSADPEADHLVLDMVPLKSLPPVPEFHPSTADERRVDNLLRQMYHLPEVPVIEAPQVAILEPPAAEPRFEATERPPQKITAEEVEAARQAVLLRRQRMAG